MFARFYAARAAKAAEAPAYVCRDRFTGLEIARGSLAQMQAFQTAFGQCEIARA